MISRVTRAGYPAKMRIFIPPEHIEQKTSIPLNKDKSHYLISVVRCRQAEKLSVIDGKGRLYEAVIAKISKETVFVDIISELKSDIESQFYLVLCQGMLKGENFDMVVQKTTELGVKVIVPIITERCVVKETKKVKRWQKIAEEAAEQCGRPFIPVIYEPVDLMQLFKSCGANSIKGFIFWEEGGCSLSEAIVRIRQRESADIQIERVNAKNIYDDKSNASFINLPAESIFILIGPEGGFTAKEIKYAENCGLIRTTLGRRILRAETAAIASVAIAFNLLEKQ